MENQLEQRIEQLKTALNLSFNEFCTMAKISTTTLTNIKDGKNISPKTLRTIAENLNVNINWLRDGKGKMFLEAKSEVVNPYREALITELKEQIEYLKKLLEMAMGGKQVGKLKPIELPSLLMVA